MTPSVQTKALLEIAVAFLERAGAHRLELCDRLDLGGLTPSLNVVRRVHTAVKAYRASSSAFFYRIIP